MDPKELEFRNLLLRIGDRLSNDNRATLGFLLGNDVPRRDLDKIAQNNHASMSIIWDALISRQKITSDNVDYLIKILEDIKRIDLAQQVKQYAATISPAQLFHQIEPANS